jgi:UDP-N-acetylmuramoyl-L-alanyl-D-glutamate--2,6-diaminopimelate ligase
MQRTQSQGGAISLRQTLAKAQFLASEDVFVSSCAADWRACRSGDVFFALTTADDDGHERAAEAIDRGAVAVVAERLLPVSVPQVLVRDSRAAMARVCQALAGNPSRNLRTVGIAGSAGKTVTSMLMASIFEAAGDAVGVMSSLGHSDSLVQQSPTGMTPTAPEFATWLERMQAARCASAVLELPAEAIAQRGTSGIGLDTAILTNLHGGNGQVSPRAASLMVERFLRHRKAGGVAVINADDHRCRRLLGELDGACLTYAMHAEADVTASVLERHASEQTFLLSAGGDCAPVRTRIIGDAHVQNCLAAAASGLALGLELETIVRGLENVERVPGRMERLECGQGFGVYVDAAHTAQTLTLAIKAVRQVTRGRTFVVFGPDNRSSAAHRALLGRVIERGAHVAVLSSNEPGHSSPLPVMHELLDGFDRPHKARVIPNRTTAIRFALENAGPGDAVLIAGHDNWGSSVASGEQPASDDREIACEWLYGRAADVPRLLASANRFRIVG